MRNVYFRLIGMTSDKLEMKTKFLLNRAETIINGSYKKVFLPPEKYCVIAKRSYFVLGMKDQMWCELQIFA